MNIQGLRVAFVAMALALITVAGCGKQAELQSQVLGRERLADITVHEKQSDLLMEWCKRGYRKKILLHISAQDGLESLTDKSVDEIGSLYKGRKTDELARSRERNPGRLFSARNYLAAAVRIGAVKEVYWVIPYKFFDAAGGGVATKNFLKTIPSLYDHEEIDRMSMQNGCLVGKVNGVKLAICSPMSLPRFKEPVVISLSGDFLRSFSAEHELSSLKGMRMLYDALYARDIRVLSLHLTRGVEEGTGLPVHSYIADEFLELVTNPQIAELESAPPIWLARDKAENMLNGGERKLVRKEAAESLKKYPDDRPLQMIDIAAQFFMGDARGAFNRAETLCKVTPVEKHATECQFLVQLGDMATETATGIPDQFYRAAVASRPKWEYALMHQGISLLDRGDFAGARPVFAELATFKDSFQLRLRRGDIEFQLGNNSGAAKFYDGAKELYSDRIGIPVSKENALSLDRMSRLYTQLGRVKDAALIDGWKKRMDSYRPGKR